MIKVARHGFLPPVLVLLVHKVYDLRNLLLIPLLCLCLSRALFAAEIPPAGGFVVKKNVVLLPLNEVAALLGATVTHDDNNYTVITQGKLSVKLSDDMLIVDDVETQMAMSMLEHDGIAYVPIAPLARVFKLRFTCDAHKPLVKIAYRNRETTIPLLPAPPDGVVDDWCRQHLEQLALGVMFLTQDNDNTFPPANKVWDALKPLQINTLCLAKDAETNGYGYNSLLSGVAMGKIADPRHTILFADGGNADHLLISATDIDQHRHHGGFFAVYVDGHAAWLPAGSPVELDYRKLDGTAPSSVH